MPLFIHNQAPAATIQSIRAAIQNFELDLAPYKVNLTEAQKRSCRIMATGREGYARLVSKIASTNISSLARDQDPVDLAARLDYDSELEGLRQALMALMEMVSETQMANGTDIMKLVDDFVTVLQVSRNSNASLDLSMSEIDDWNKRFVNSGLRPDQP